MKDLGFKYLFEIKYFFRKYFKILHGSKIKEYMIENVNNDLFSKSNQAGIVSKWKMSTVFKFHLNFLIYILNNCFTAIKNIQNFFF